MAWQPKRYEKVGCLNREFTEFSEQRGIAEARRLYPELDAVLRHHSSKVETCFDFLVDEYVIDLMDVHPAIMAAFICTRRLSTTAI